MNTKVLKLLEDKYLNSSIPEFNVGDTLKVYLKIIEGDKKRTQMFQGVVLGIRGSGTRKMFTIRKIAQGGIAVERILPLHSPMIQKIEIVKKATKVRRAKLYYLRERIGKMALYVK